MICLDHTEIILVEDFFVLRGYYEFGHCFSSSVASY
jgi:hypothetical protein